MNQDISRVSYEPHLAICGYKHLCRIVQDFKVDETLASPIRAIDILDEEDQEVQESTKTAEDEQSSRDQELQFCSGVVSVIEHVCRHGFLESFSWPNARMSHIRLSRPEPFWEALSKNAPTLEELELGFYLHEIHDLGELDAFPVTFTALKTLTLGIRGAHGDNATTIDSMLRKTSSLTSLTLDMPTCRLKSCRIQGISYDWHFPDLKIFEINVRTDNNGGLLGFFSRHQWISSMTFGVSTDEPLGIPGTCLRFLCALSLSSWSHVDSAQVNLLAHPSCRAITHLRVESAAPDSYHHLASNGGSIRCLEIHTTAWRNQVAQQSMRRLIESLPALEELDIFFRSGDASYRDDNGTLIHVDPFSAHDLALILSRLSSTSRLRALKMTDTRSSTLGSEVLGKLPRVPHTLEYLGWTIDGQDILYKLEWRDDNERRAVKCRRPPRAADGGRDIVRAPWTEESILDHHVLCGCGFDASQVVFADESAVPH